MPNQHDEELCPLAAVDRRLEDLHQQWHQAEQNYFDPNAFRIAIQTAIQTSRTVSFILQSNKRLFQFFDEWYEPWQEKLRGDPLMRWMVDARNRIEKQGDLQAHSFVRAEIIASHLNEGPNIEVPAELFQSPTQLLKNIPKNALGDHILKDGILRIQRRWVENTLKDYDLLDAVALAYGRIADLVHDAHKQLGLEGPTTINTSSGEVFPEGIRSGRLPCMIGHGDSRSLDIWLATGTPIRLSKVNHEVNFKDAEKVSKKYGISPDEIFRDDGSKTGFLENLFVTARKMFMADGHHVSVVFLLIGAKPVRILQIVPEEHGEKYLIMRSIAHEVVKCGADAVVTISEVWMAPADSIGPYQRVKESPERREALVATLVSRYSDPVQCIARIERADNAVSLGQTETLHGGAQFLFAPIYEVWGREVPADWIDQTKNASKGT